MPSIATVPFRSSVHLPPSATVIGLIHLLLLCSVPSDSYPALFEYGSTVSTLSRTIRSSLVAACCYWLVLLEKRFLLNHTADIYHFHPIRLLLPFFEPTLQSPRTRWPCVSASASILHWSFSLVSNTCLCSAHNHAFSWPYSRLSAHSLQHFSVIHTSVIWRDDRAVPRPFHTEMYLTELLRPLHVFPNEFPRHVVVTFHTRCIPSTDPISFFAQANTHSSLLIHA